MGSDIVGQSLLSHAVPRCKMQCFYSQFTNNRAHIALFWCKSVVNTWDNVGQSWDSPILSHGAKQQERGTMRTPPFYRKGCPTVPRLMRRDLYRMKT